MHFPHRYATSYFYAATHEVALDFPQGLSYLLSTNHCLLKVFIIAPFWKWVNFLVWASMYCFSSKLHFPLTVSLSNLVAHEIYFTTHDKNSHQSCPYASLDSLPYNDGEVEDPKSRLLLTPSVLSLADDFTTNVGEVIHQVSTFLTILHLIRYCLSAHLVCI